jgi:hypothetical protein
MLIWDLDGFSLDHNPSDVVYLDDIIFRELTSSQKEDLELQQYLG